MISLENQLGLLDGEKEALSEEHAKKEEMRRRTVVGIEQEIRSLMSAKQQRASQLKKAAHDVSTLKQLFEQKAADFSKYVKECEDYTRHGEELMKDKSALEAQIEEARRGNMREKVESLLVENNGLITAQDTIGAQAKRSQQKIVRAGLDCRELEDSLAGAQEELRRVQNEVILFERAAKSRSRCKTRRPRSCKAMLRKQK